MNEEARARAVGEGREVFCRTCGVDLFSGDLRASAERCARCRRRRSEKVLLATLTQGMPRAMR
jgi:hypothetical protein